MFILTDVYNKFFFLVFNKSPDYVDNFLNQTKNILVHLLPN